jgi:exopolysaccharide/PEP-CTERM locus tyrosine autokinase
MNEITPRRLKGSLVERAAEVFNYGELPVLPPEQGRAQPAPVAQPPVYPQPAQQQQAPQPMPVPRVADVPVQRFAPPIVEPHPVFPSEPAVPSYGIAIDRDRLAECGMLVPGAPVGTLAEEFRLVKRQLLLTARSIEHAERGAIDRSRMILVCSAQPNEGKTFCAINLALSMAAEQDVEILLVDADFAKPDVLKRLGAPEGPGLLDVLAGSVASVEQCIVPTDVPNLSLLPAGTKSARDTELIASDRARAVLERLAAADARRIVIFDSPPVLAASPASVLALHGGQVLLVVRADCTSESDLREAVGLLEGCEHIQLVLNSVSFQPGGRRFGSYYGDGK